jgi:D-alanyl-lipoteichoic acid acyltransferase DltB (MBOAT superfamily)
MKCLNGDLKEQEGAGFVFSWKASYHALYLKGARKRRLYRTRKKIHGVRMSEANTKMAAGSNRLNVTVFMVINFLHVVFDLSCQPAV